MAMLAKMENRFEVNDLQNDQLSVQAKTGFVRHRYVICLLTFFGLALVYAMRVNMSVTIIAMVGSKGTNKSEGGDGTCPAPEVQPIQGEFDWSEKTKGAVLYAFFIGYISTQIIGGIMADKMSVKLVFEYGIFLTSILTLVTHWVARWSVYGLILLRVLEGITEGVTFPAMFALLARWAPAPERTTMVNLCMMGTTIGTVVTLPAAAALSESSLGWPAAFYIPGLLGLVWSAIWHFCATSQPENHRWISNEECNYIIQNRGTSHSADRTIPWKKILTSRSVILFAYARFCVNVTFYMFLTEIPTFIDNIFHVPMSQNGGLNSFFYVFFACGAFGSGYLSDRLISSGVLSRTNVRKLFGCTSLALSGVMLLILTQIGCRMKLAATVLCFAAVSLALNGGGDAAMPLDLAPEHAGSIMAVGNMVGNLSGIFVPLLVSFITDHNITLPAWNVVFVVTALISLTGAIVFGIFASAEEEPWSKGEGEKTQIADNA